MRNKDTIASLLSDGSQPADSKKVADKKQKLKSKLKQESDKFEETMFQVELESGSKMANKVLKHIFLFFLYVSYGLLIVAVLLILLNENSMRQELINYINEQSNLVELIVLIILGIFIFIVYKYFTQDQNLTARYRRALNFILDFMRIAFHVIYLFYIKGFVFQNTQNSLIAAFWITVAAVALFIVRTILKWIHYCCGAGKKNIDKIWGNTFKLEEKRMKKHIQMLDQLKKILEQTIRNNQKPDEENKQLVQNN